MFISTNNFAQDWSFNQEEEAVYNKIIAGACDQIIIKNSTPSSLYLSNLQETISLLLSEKESDLEQYEISFENKLEALEKIESNSPYQGFYLAEIRLRAAFIYLKFDHRLDAGWQFRQASKLIENNIKIYPDFIPSYKTIGLIHLLVGSVPEKYQWILSLAGLNGSVKNGINELNRAIEAESVYSLEATLLLSLCQAYILQKPESGFEQLKNLGSPQGSILTLAKMAVFMKNNQSQIAIQLFNETEKKNLCIPHIKYLAAEAHLQKGLYSMATTLYQQYLSDFDGFSNRKDTYYKLFLCQYLNNDTTNQQAFLKSAEQIKIEATEADRYAGKMIQSKNNPNSDILKIRLATDGGFYEIAKKILKDNPKLNDKKDSIEIIYREARLAHKMNETKRAMVLYLSVIKLSDGYSWYFAPNSALMLGHILIDEGDANEAILYYMKAKSYKYHEYKLSIDTQAEAALNLIDSK